MERQYITDTLGYLVEEKEQKSAHHTRGSNKISCEYVSRLQKCSGFHLNNRHIRPGFVFYHCFVYQGRCTDTWVHLGH